MQKLCPNCIDFYTLSNTSELVCVCERVRVFTHFHHFFLSPHEPRPLPPLPQNWLKRAYTSLHANAWTHNIPLMPRVAVIKPCEVRGPYGPEMGSCYLCLVTEKGVHSALSANWSLSPQDLQVEWIMRQTWRRDSPSSWCYWLKISVEWIMHLEKKNPHLVVELLTLTGCVRRGEMDIFCFWWSMREDWVLCGKVITAETLLRCYRRRQRQW